VVAIIVAQTFNPEGPLSGVSAPPQQNEIEIGNAHTPDNTQRPPANNAGPSGLTSDPLEPDVSPNFGILGWPSSEYDDVFGGGEPSSPLEKVHARFTEEPRDESWASAMESGISHALVKSDATARITVDYVRCHTTICEVSGFMPDSMENPQLDPRSLLPDDLGEGWWQGRISTGIGEHTYEGEGITRFIIIIAEPRIFLSASE